MKHNYTPIYCPYFGGVSKMPQSNFHILRFRNFNTIRAENERKFRELK